MALETRQHRRELLETIESQKETISKYETRLKDVVRAYKGLAKEKEVLETTLRAISADSKHEPEVYLPSAGSRESSRRGSDAGVSTASQESEVNLESKVKTLTSSLATLTMEKSKLESSFQEDRKKLIQDRKEKDKMIEKLRKDLEQVETKSKLELEESKSKLIVERYEREKETSDHAVMIRELQKLLADERRAKERLESSLQETEQKMKVQVGLEDFKRKEEKDKKLKEVEVKLKVKTDEVDRCKEKLKETEDTLDSMKEEMFNLRVGHRTELERFERKAEMAETNVSRAKVEQEQRVNTLESRLQELSETVGTYDRLRHHDQQEIQKLKEKIANFKESEMPKRTSPDLTSLENMHVSALSEYFLSIKKILLEKSSESELAHLGIYSDDQLHWKEDYNILKSEFESYKKQCGPSHSPTAGRYLLPEVDQEAVLSLKTQISELQDKSSGLKALLRHSEAEIKTISGERLDLREQLQVARQQTKDRCDAIENDYRAKLLELETELQKQRDRCLTLIEEKEDEVNMLKSNLENALEKAFASPDRETQLRIMTQVSNSGRKSRNSSRATEDEFTEGLRSNTPDGMVLHYVQELSHKDVLISGLREKVFALESAMREVQMSAVAKVEKYVDEIDNLNEEVARAKRMAAGGKDGGANMEYLKNVVLSYMLSSDASSRDHMLKAIGAVLLFSKKDMKKVKDHNASWFWSQNQAGKP